MGQNQWMHHCIHTARADVSGHVSDLLSRMERTDVLYMQFPKDHMAATNRWDVVLSNASRCGKHIQSNRHRTKCKKTESFRGTHSFIHANTHTCTKLIDRACLMVCRFILSCVTITYHGNKTLAHYTSIGHLMHPIKWLLFLMVYDNSLRRILWAMQ